MHLLIYYISTVSYVQQKKVSLSDFISLKVIVHKKNETSVISYSTSCHINIHRLKCIYSNKMNDVGCTAC